MANILKQFSLDEPVIDVPKKNAVDVLQNKYISAKPDLTSVHPPKKQKTIHKTKDPKPHKIVDPKRYLIQLPTLILSLLCYYSSFIIFQKIQPQAIKDFILPNSYLSIIVTLGAAHFFMFWYLSQQLRRSAILAILLSCLLFLRLHQLWHPVLLLLVGLPLIGLELLLTYKSFRR